MPKGRKTLSDAQIHRAYERLNAGEGTVAVADELGVTTHCVYERGRRLGLRIDRPRLPQRWRASRLKLPIDPAALAYLAAMIDGEGHLTRWESKRAGSREVMYQVCISNTSVALIDWLRPFGGTIRCKKQRVNHPVYIWGVMAKLEVIELLQAVEPYMIIKRDKALAFLEELTPLAAHRS